MNALLRFEAKTWRNIRFQSVALNFECVERFTWSCPRVGREESKSGRYPSSGVIVATWPRELYNRMASLERFAFWSVPRVHTSRFPPANKLLIPHRNRVTYSSPFDPPALSRILSSIRGILFPPIIVFPFIAINVNRGRSYIREYIYNPKVWGGSNRNV